MFTLPLMFVILTLVVVTVFFPPAGLVLLALAAIAMLWGILAKSRGRKR